MNGKNKDIEALVEETLNSLEGIRPAVPRPFFHTRLQARIERYAAPAKTGYRYYPAWQKMALAGIIALLLFNLFTAYQFLGNSDASVVGAQTIINEYYNDAISVDYLEYLVNP
jgi:hypothetical protein